MEKVGLIIGIISGIIGMAWAAHAWLWPFLSRFIKIPVIIKLHASIRKDDSHFVVWPNMALGIEARNALPEIGKNIIHFVQSEGTTSLDVPVSGKTVTGGSHAPGPTVLTVPVPSVLRPGKANITLEANTRKCAPLPICVCSEPQAPTLIGFGTTFADSRSPSGAAGKLVVIGGFGFSIDAQCNIVSFSSGNFHATSTPTAVRGDALLGVVIPSGLPYGPVGVTVHTLFGDKRSSSSNLLTLTVVPPLRITDIDPYVRPGEELTIRAESISDRHKSATWVVLEPYHDRKPISLQAKRVPTEKEIIVRIPGRGIKPGPYDARIIVDGNYSENSVVVDIQKKSKRRKPEERNGH